MAAKTAYQFNHAGLFMGSTVADESPEEEGVWHVPASATLVSPPEEWPEKKWPRWNGSSWDLVNKPKPRPEPTATEKLAAFLRDNPDVASMIDPELPDSSGEIPQEESTD